MKDNELAVVNGSQELASADFSMEELMEEMDGLGAISLDAVKIPSGGGLAFEVPGDDPDNPDIVKEIKGVVLYRHASNGYWRSKFGGEDKIPDCFSNDGKLGVVTATGECRDCDKCPLNQFAEDGSGKACKNMQNLYILREGDMLPIQLVLPPTSIKNLRDYVGKRLLCRRKKLSGVITSITLSKAESKSGIKYAVANFAYKGDLSPQQILEMAPIAQMCKNIAESRGRSGGAAGEAFGEIVSEEPLPFDEALPL